MQWLSEPSGRRIFSGAFLIFGVVLLLCYTLTVQSRSQQLQVWEATPERYFVEEKPLYTTADAPYYLRLAKNLQLGEYPRIDPKREFPLGRPNLERPPLLSQLLAWIGPWFPNLYLAGTWLVILGAGLFVLPLGLYGWQLGVPWAGLLGGLVGSFSIKYYVRTSVGRIDTDFLNLFFPLLTASLLLATYQSRQAKGVWTCSALAGFSMFLFSWWYDRPAFALGFFLILLVGLLIWRHPARHVFPALLLFILFSGPDYFLGSLQSLTVVLGIYLKIGLVSEAQAQAAVPVEFPHAYNWIAETIPLPPEQSLGLILNHPYWSGLGLLCFVLAAVRSWKQYLPLLPIFGLGSLALFSSQRFLFYLTPFVGFGLGLLLQPLWLWLGQQGARLHGRFFPAGALSTWMKDRSIVCAQLWLYLGLLLTWQALKPWTAIGFVPEPTLSPALYRAYEEVGQIVPEGGVIYSWWNHGNALLELTDRAVFHDGGSQYGPKTFFIARSLVSTDPQELKNLMHFLGALGDRGIERWQHSQRQLQQEIDSGKHRAREPLHLLLNQEMIEIFPILSDIGTWDTQTQRGNADKFVKLQCDRLEQQQLSCENFTIDLQRGLINEVIPLRRVVQSLQGNQVFLQEYQPQGLTLQLMMPDPQQFDQIYLLTERVWASNLNQLFLLGQDPLDLFEEELLRYPELRLFRLRP